MDEWHELMGGKRGVQVELAISRILGAVKNYQPQEEAANKPARKKTVTLSRPISIWGISATIGNLEQAMEVLLASTGEKGVIIKANIQKKMEKKVMHDSTTSTVEDWFRIHNT